MHSCKKIANNYIIKFLAIFYVLYFTTFSYSAPFLDNSYINIHKIELETKNDRLYVDVNSEINLDLEIINAISKGLPISFILKSKIYTSKWYWMDNVISENEYIWSISYMPFLNKYKLYTKNGNSKYFNNFADALNLVTHIKNLLIFDKFNLESLKLEQYNISMRLYVDTNKLPKVISFYNKSIYNFNIDSGWKDYAVFK